MRIIKTYELMKEARKLFLKIKGDSVDNLASIIDAGYNVDCKDDLRWIIVYISVPKVDSSFWIGNKLSSIKDDIMSYLEIMNEKNDIQFIEFHGWKKSISDQTNFGLTKIYTIDELNNCDDFYFSSIKIAFNKVWKK
jgi:hypothetical protein